MTNLLSGGRIRADAFEAFAKQAVIDINNSKTELIYPPEGGILAQEKTNPLEQVRLTSKGLGISTDGWNSVRTAVTAKGIAAEVIAGQLGSFVSLLIGKDNDVTQINTKGIAAGHADFNSAPFQVDMKGNLLANKLTANYAQIKSSNFSEGAIVGSSINVGNGKFIVNTNGSVFAADGTFQGTINAKSGTFEGPIYSSGEIIGGIITGALIRTAVSRERVEIDPNGFRFYDLYNALRVTLGTNPQADISGHTYYNSSSQSQGLIYANPDEFHVMGVNDSRLGALRGRMYLQGSVHFTSGSSVTGLELGIDQISGLQSKLDDIWRYLSSHTHTVTIPNHNHGKTEIPNSGGGTFTTSTP